MRLLLVAGLLALVSQRAGMPPTADGIVARYPLADHS
jgi:hypothetical protein